MATTTCYSCHRPSACFLTAGTPPGILDFGLIVVVVLCMCGGGDGGGGAVCMVVVVLCMCGGGGGGGGAVWVFLTSA